MHADDAPVDDALGEYDVVVANIEARVLIEMAPRLARRVRGGGVLVLSGILRGQEKEVANAYAELAVRRSMEEGEWVAIVLERAIVTNL
jgi:ribosomal protein L11 methyltransferase